MPPKRRSLADYIEKATDRVETLLEKRYWALREWGGDREPYTEKVDRDLQAATLLPEYLVSGQANVPEVTGGYWGGIAQERKQYHKLKVQAWRDAWELDHRGKQLYSDPKTGMLASVNMTPEQRNRYATLQVTGAHTGGLDGMDGDTNLGGVA